MNYPPIAMFATAAWLQLTLCVVQAEPKRLDTAQIKVVEVHPLAGVFQLSVTADEKYLITGTKEIKWWKLPEFELVKTMKVDYPIFHVRISPNGKYLAVYDTGKESAMRILNADSGKQIFQTRPCVVAFAPNGEQIAMSSDGLLTMRKVATGEVIYETAAFDNPVASVHFSPDGRFLYVAHADLSCLDSATGKKVWTAERIIWDARDPAVRWFQWSWDSVIASEDGRFLKQRGGSGKLFEAASGRVVASFKPQPISVSIERSVFDSDSRSLLGMTTVSGGGLFRWDLFSGALVLKSDPGHLQPVTSAIFLRRHHLLAIGTNGGGNPSWGGKLFVLPIESLPKSKPKPATMGEDELVARWKLLRDSNTGDAIEAMNILIDYPDQTVPFLSKHIKSVPEDRQGNSPVDP